MRQVRVGVRATVIIGVALCSLGGCGGDDDATRPEVEWQLFEDLRIGSADSEGPDQFSYIADLWVDPMDRIWVIDGPSQEIRVFSASGVPIRSFGRPGGGPGELGVAAAIEGAPDGTVWIADSGNGRFQVFDTAGVALTSHAYAPRMYRFGDRWGTDGLLYTHVFVGGSGPDLQMEVVRRRLVEGALEPVDTLAVPAAPLGRTVPVRFIRNGVTMTQMVPLPFQSTPVRHLEAGEGWWVSAAGGDYRVLHTDFSGDTLAIAARDYTPVPVSPADLEDALANFPEGAEIPVEEVPEFHPPVAGLETLPDGHLLVHRQAEVGPVFDLFDPEGAFVATLAIPDLSVGPAERFELRVTHDAALYGIARDDLDVPHIVRLRLRR